MGSLMLSLYKIVHTFRTKIYEYIKNYFHRGKKHPLQEVGGGYIFTKHSDAFTLLVAEFIYII